MSTLTILLWLAAVGANASECIGWRGFEAPVRYSSAADQVVLLADLDGDGNPEIITSGNQVDELGTFSVLINRGDGTFMEERLIESHFGEKLETVGDLNGDHIPDLVASDYWSNGIVVHRGRGSLQFEAGTPYGTATHGGPSLIADYDNDGTPDIISFSFGSGNPVRVHRFRGKGDGTLFPKTTVETFLANAVSPSTRNVNGALEILVGEHSGHLGLFRFANGTLSLSLIAAGPALDQTSTFADVNGDGIADIVDTSVSEPGSESTPVDPIFITLGKADGTFLDRKQLSGRRQVAFPIPVRAGDFDGDGYADLMVSDFRSTRLYYYRGDGTGNFAEGVAIDAGGSVNDFKAADVNRDGRLDLVTVNDDHSVSVIINRGACLPERRRAVKH
jgi:hypothetical protein